MTKIIVEGEYLVWDGTQKFPRISPFRRFPQIRPGPLPPRNLLKSKWSRLSIPSCIAPQSQTFKITCVTYLSSAFNISRVKKEKKKQHLKISADSAHSLCTTNLRNPRKVGIISFYLLLKLCFISLITFHQS